MKWEAGGGSCSGRRQEAVAGGGKQLQTVGCRKQG